LAEYQRAVLATPHDPELLNDLGYFLYTRGRHAEAEKWLREALLADPHHQRAQVNLGSVLARQSRTLESLDVFQKALGPAQAFANVGLLLAQDGRNAEAAPLLRKALELDPNLIQARAALASLEHTGPRPDWLTPPTGAPGATPAGSDEVLVVNLPVPSQPTPSGR
jgi:Tfp pilus assembly protein PilF